MKYTLLHTKLNRPPIAHDIVPRVRLAQRLDQGRKRPMTLLSAPAGYGKSTLVSGWISSAGCPCAWISLDENDNNLRQFLSYLLAAIQQAFDKIRLRTEAFLDAQRLPPFGELARSLLNDLHQVPEPFILALDDYQCITETSVHDFAAALLEHPVKTMHLVLLTRKDPSLPIAAMRGRGLVTEIRASDLRFTPDEVATFMSNMLNVAVDDDTAALLEAKTEGWAAGLRLAGLYLKGQKDLKLRVHELGGSSGHIAEYLVAEVLSQQHPEMLSYLLETSILDRFCAPLCGQMHLKGSQGRSGKPEIGEERFMKWLVGANLFVIALDDKGYWFRYHHLFHGFLKGELRKQCSADRIAVLHRIAGNWFGEKDLIEEAIKHLMAAGETSLATQQVIDHRHELMNSSQFARLMRLLNQLPKKAVTESPLLATTQAFIGIDMGNDEAMYRNFQKASQMLEALSPQSEIYAVLKCEVTMLQSLIEMILGDAESALVHAKEGLNDLPENAILIRSLGVGVVSICHQMMGNSKRAVTVIKKALSNPIWPANIRARIHFYLSIVQYMEANLAGVMNASQECLQAIGDLPFFHTRAFANYFLGAGRYLRNELEAAESVLLKVLDDRHTVNPSYVAHAGFILAYICLSRGSQVASDRVLDQIIAHCREIDNASVLSIIEAFESEFALHRGDFPRAHQICKYADFDVRPPLWFFYVPQLTPIKCLLAEGSEDSLKKAHTRLIEWEGRMRRINRVNVRIEILALLALVCYKQRDEDAALECLQTALELAEPGGWIRTFVDLGIPMMDLLKCLIQYQPGQPYAQQVLKAWQWEHRKIAHAEPDETTKPRISEQPPHNVLTPREIEILPLLSEGLSNKEIASRLSIAQVTVKTHLKNIYKKLNTKNRIEALKKSREIGIIIDN